MEVPTKSRAGVRSIDISPEIAQMLKDHIAGRTTGLVFMTKAGRPLGKDNVRHSLHRILANLKTPRGGLHSFRHGRVSMLRKSGVVLDDLVREWIGHSNLRTTSRYPHFGDSYRHEVAQQVGIFANQPPQMKPQLRVGPKTPDLDPSVSKLESFQSAVTQGVSW